MRQGWVVEGEYFYWPRLIWNETRWYLGQGRPLGLLRTLLIRLHGNNVETCQECGRDYPLWHAPDALWAEFVDAEGGGLLCIDCFDNKTRAAGLILQWLPRVFRDKRTEVPTSPASDCGMSSHSETGLLASRLEA